MSSIRKLGKSRIATKNLGFHGTLLLIMEFDKFLFNSNY